MNQAQAEEPLVQLKMIFFFECVGAESPHKHTIYVVSIFEFGSHASLPCAFEFLPPIVIFLLVLILIVWDAQFRSLSCTYR